MLFLFEIYILYFQKKLLNQSKKAPESSSDSDSIELNEKPYATKKGNNESNENKPPFKCEVCLYMN